MKSKEEIVVRVLVHGKRELKSFLEAFGSSVLFGHITKTATVEGKDAGNHEITLYIKGDFEYGLKQSFTNGQLIKWKDNFKIQKRERQ